jgi:hypothetical protein
MSLNPFRTFLPEQYGQLLPLNLCATEVCQLWPREQRHHTTRPDAGVTISGVSEPFLSTSHSPMNAAFFDAKSLKPGSTAFPEQYGQPLPPVLFRTAADQLWPF